MVMMMMMKMMLMVMTANEWRRPRGWQWRWGFAIQQVDVDDDDDDGGDDGDGDEDGAQPSPVNGMQLGFRVTDSYMDSPAQRPPKWNARFSGRGKRLWSLETHAASKTRLLFACQEPPPEFFSQEPLGRAGGNASHQSSDEINVHTPAHIEMIFDFLDDLSTIFRRWLRTNYDPSISHC